MKALTGFDPWFSAILDPVIKKDIENRSWPTIIRGTIALHTSQKTTRHEYEYAKDVIEETCEIQGKTIIVPGFRNLILGCVIGVVDIVGCVKQHDSPWFFGEFGFVLANPRKLTQPIPCRGALSFWNLPAEVESAVREQLSNE